jgi:hypothetical protein
VWRVAADGRLGPRILVPLRGGLRTDGAVEQVWSTDLRLDTDGRRLAVQSCHPHGCLTRMVDLETGAVGTIDEAHGPLIGWTADAIVGWAACHGRPCDVLAWSVAGGGVQPGLARGIADAVSGAGLSGDGRQLVVRREADGHGTLLSIDLRRGSTTDLGPLGADEVPLAGDAGADARIELGPRDAAIGAIGRIPVVVQLDATTSAADGRLRP